MASPCFTSLVLPFLWPLCSYAITKTRKKKKKLWYTLCNTLQSQSIFTYSDGIFPTVPWCRGGPVIDPIFTANETEAWRDNTACRIHIFFPFSGSTSPKKRRLCFREELRDVWTKCCSADDSRKRQSCWGCCDSRWDKSSEKVVKVARHM